MNAIRQAGFAMILALGLMVALGGCDKRRNHVDRHDGYRRGYSGHHYQRRDVRRRPPDYRQRSDRPHDDHGDRHDRDHHRHDERHGD